MEEQTYLRFGADRERASASARFALRGDLGACMVFYWLRCAINPDCYCCVISWVCCVTALPASVIIIKGAIPRRCPDHEFIRDSRYLLRLIMTLFPIIFEAWKPHTIKLHFTFREQ